MIRVGDHLSKSHSTVVTHQNSNQLPDTTNRNSNSLILNHLKLAIVIFCSITNKKAELEAFLVSNSIDVLIGTESHLDKSIQNSEIFPKKFNTYRKDRNRFGGGVFVSVKNTVPSS